MKELESCHKQESLPSSSSLFHELHILSLHFWHAYFSSSLLYLLFYSKPLFTCYACFFITLVCQYPNPTSLFLLVNSFPFCFYSQRLGFLRGLFFWGLRQRCSMLVSCGRRLWGYVAQNVIGWGCGQVKLCDWVIYYCIINVRLNFYSGIVIVCFPFALTFSVLTPHLLYPFSFIDLCSVPLSSLSSPKYAI